MIELLSILFWSFALTYVRAVADVPTLADCMHAVHADDELSCAATFQEFFEELDVDGDGQLSSHERDVLFSTPIDDMILPVFFPEGSNDVCTFEHFCDSMVTLQFPELGADADEEILADFCEQEELLIAETCEDDWNSLFPDRHVNAEDQTGAAVSMTKTEYRKILMTSLNTGPEEWDQEQFLRFMQPTAQTEHLSLLLDLTANYGLPVVRVQDYKEPVNNCVVKRRKLFLGAIVATVAVVVSSVVAAGVQTAATGGNWNDFAQNLAVHALTNGVTAVGCATAVGCVLGGAVGGISGALLQSSMCGGRSACWKAEDYLWAAGTGAAAGVAASYADEILSVGVDDAGAVFFYTAANGAIGAVGGGANAIYSGPSSPGGGLVPGWHRIGQWRHIGYGGCTYGRWIKIGTAHSLKQAMSLAMGNDVCSQAGSVLFYSAYSYDYSWGVRCATHANFGSCRENNPNWQEYQFHTDVKQTLNQHSASVIATATKEVFTTIGNGHCVDNHNRRPAHCWGSIGDKAYCERLCAGDQSCVAYEYGQNYGGILCQLIYFTLPSSCPDTRMHRGYSQGGNAVTKTFHNTGGACHKKGRVAVNPPTNQVFTRIGNGHCVDGHNRRPAHCWGSIGDKAYCERLCAGDALCVAYEYGQNYGGILCQLIYFHLPSSCPDNRLHRGNSQGGYAVTKTYHNTGGACYKK